MGDQILRAFLQRQCDEGMELAAASDILNLVPVRDQPPTQYIMEFHCKGLTRVDGAVSETAVFACGLNFPADYLRRVTNAAHILMWVHPTTVFHPNISATGPFICIGDIKPGTGIFELAYRVFDVITWKNFCACEQDSLNAEACIWARNHMSRFPVDERPLKRRPGLQECA